MKRKFICSGVLSLLMLILFGCAQKKSPEKAISIEEKISEISELAVLRYDHTIMIVRYGDPVTWYGFELKDKDEYLVGIPGTLKFGVDLRKKKIDESGRIEDTEYPAEIRIKLPHCGIISNELHQKDRKVYTIKNHKLSSVSYDKPLDDEAKLKDDAVLKAKEKGLFDEADKLAKAQIENMIRPLLQNGQKLIIEFVKDEELEDN